MGTKALLVGINRYRQVPGRKGCVNDVVNLRDVLKRVRGISNDDIRIVINERATKDAILERLIWLVRDVRPGDTRIFHFSGHGSQIRDRGELDELNDHLDEIICPHDMDWDDHFITDDELERVLKVPEGVTYFLCKHLRDTSGTANRTQLVARVRESLRLAGFPQVPELRAEPRAAAAPFFELEKDMT